MMVVQRLSGTRLNVLQLRRRRFLLAPLVDVIFIVLIFFLVTYPDQRSAFVPLLSKDEISSKTDADVVHEEEGQSDGNFSSRPREKPPNRAVLVTLSEDGWLLNGRSIPVNEVSPSLGLLKARGASVVLLSVKLGTTSQQLFDALEVVRSNSLGVTVLK